MELRFSKMHGLGNDFMVIDLVTQQCEITTEMIKQWSDRHTGIGFDQLLVVEVPELPEVDFKYRIYNADGGEVEQCGNGARCFARFVKMQGLTPKNQVVVETSGGIIELNLHADNQVTVDMGIPSFLPQSLPFTAEATAETYQLELEQQSVEIAIASIGNPHAVVMVEDIDTAPVATQGPQIEGHSRFPQRVNAGFMQIISPTYAKLRVYERGVGETQACGTGACAAMVTARRRGLLEENAVIELTGGKLNISWPGENSAIQMTGPTAHVFEGTVDL